jgi:hypothetical protein
MTMMPNGGPPDDGGITVDPNAMIQELLRQVAALSADLAATRAALSQTTRERDTLAIQRLEEAAHVEGP